MDRLYGSNSQYYQDERRVNEALAAYGLHYGSQVTVQGQTLGGVAPATIVAVEVEYIRPYEKRAPRIGVLLAISFEDGSGVHRMYPIEQVAEAR